MPIDPNIALAVKTPEPISPLQTIGGLMQLRDTMSQTALRDAQTQQAQQQSQDLAQQAAQRQRDNQSYNKLQDLMRDPDTHSKVAQGDYSPIYGAGVTANVASAAIKNFDEQRKTAQSLKTGDLDLYLKGRGLLKDMLDGADSEKDDAISAAQYNSGRQNLAQAAPQLAKNLPILQPGVNYRQQLAGLINTNSFHHEMLKDAADLAAKGAETNKAGSEADLNKAKTAGEQLQQQLMQHKLDLYNTLKQNPAALQARVVQAIDSKKYPDEFMRTLAAAQSAPDLEGVNAAIKDGGDRIGRLEAGIAQAKATAPIKIEVGQGIQQGAAGNATGAGLDLMAEQALNGQFTSRNPMLLTKVYARAAELAQQRGMNSQQVLMQRNAAKANQTALGQLTSMNTRTEAFANLAEKNMTLAEQAIANVSNLGAPVLNTPVRDLQSRFMGNTNVAALRAALVPAQTELARLLNSPNATGVLTDDARHEMESATTPGATPGQLKAAFGVFRQEIQNRRDSYNAAVSDLQGRTVVGTSMGQPAKPAGAQPASSAPKFKVGDSVMYNGKPHKVTGIKPDGKLILDGNQ